MRESGQFLVLSTERGGHGGWLDGLSSLWTLGLGVSYADRLLLRWVKAVVKPPEHRSAVAVA